MVVGEDRVRDAGQDPVRQQVLSCPRDGVGRFVHAGDAVAVAVGRDAVDVHVRGMHRRSAPGVGGRSADADLHRPGRAECVGPAAHPRQRGPAVIALDLADPREHDPRHLVPGADRLELAQVVGRDRVARLRADRGLSGGDRASGARAAGREHDAAAREEQHRRHERADDEERQQAGQAQQRGLGEAAREPDHGLPAEANSMSFTCQLDPVPVSVTA